MIVELARGASDFNRINFSRVCETAGTSTSNHFPRAFANGESAPQGMMNGEIPNRFGRFDCQKSGQSVAAVFSGAGW